MSLLSWNCQGLGNPRPVRDLHRLVEKKKPGLVFLMETKLRALRMETIKAKLGFGSIFTVDSVGRSGGLALLWNDEFDVHIKHYSHRHIHAEVWGKNRGHCWVFTGFYGHPEAAKRKEAWSLLQHIRVSSSDAWICVGDFNEVMEDGEKWGGCRKPRWQMQEFRDTVEMCHLYDLGFSGPKFTWSNKRHDEYFTQERLDRAMANSAWIDVFPRNHVEVVAACNSDHLPLFVYLEKNLSNIHTRPKAFRYVNGWGKYKENREAIKKIWKVKDTQTNSWTRTFNKLDHSKKAIVQ
jgi:hypothetical protein